MSVSQIVTENQLDTWTRGNAAQAQGKIVELVWRLVCASCPHPIYRHFPLPDSIGQHGSDGELDTAVGYEPFVPEGKSVWEIGTNVNARKKANEDFSDSTAAIPANIRAETTFVFVTPLSGRRDWKDTWKPEGIQTWLAEKRGLKKWKQVIVLDGTQLIDWAFQFPGVGHWLGALIGQLPDDFDTAEYHWQIISAFGEPPPLSPDLFVSGREGANERLRRLIIERNDNQLRLDTRYPLHLTDYVSAFIASLGDEERFSYQNRVLVFDSPEVFKSACSLSESHVFIANSDLDTANGAQLIQRAIQRRHAVIYASPPGGPPHGNACELFNPHVHEMKEALTKAGYTEERARSLTNRSGRDLSALLRLIQNLSALPEWATQSRASDLAIAQFLGQWEDGNSGDQAVIEDLSGKAYGEWIISIREAAGAKAAPLEFALGRWKFTSRYEPWLYLGKLVGPGELERFERVAIRVFSEEDPRLALPKEQRFAAGIYGEQSRYSRALRHGISETLALLGAHGQSLSTCPDGLPQNVARHVVTKLLGDASSKLWASLNDVLPLLAEAAPEAFLSAVGGASEKPNQPFSGVFAEEADEFLGGSFVTGLLWALESLAWSDTYFFRACCVLANLAAVDPGGRWSNRPANSLTAILLPWLPQTVANMQKRHLAVRAIVREQPGIGWKLLLDLLPERHSSSSHTHKPKWQNFIPEDWKNGVTNGQRWEDEGFYADLALEIAGNDPTRLSELLPYYFHIHPRFSNFSTDFKDRLSSAEFLSLPEEQRLGLWTDLTTKIANHRKYADSDAWTVPEKSLADLEALAERLKPIEPDIRYRRLFSGRDFDLYDEKGKWEDQQKRLLQRRIEALRQIFSRAGFQGLRMFWRSVESPQDVGAACGADEALACDEEALPALLESSEESDVRFAVSYVWRRFQTSGWTWADCLDRSTWSIWAKAEFFATLPFVNEVWMRVSAEFGSDESEFWKRTRVNCDRNQLENIGHGLARLIENGRPDAAIQCFWLCDLWSAEYLELGLRALEAFDVDKNRIDAHAIQEVFNHLQKDANVDEERVANMEVKFLELLDRFSGARPRTLYRHLAERPEFFCAVIRMIFRSKHDPKEQEGENTVVDEKRAKIAGRAYRLLMDWNHPPGQLADGNFDGEQLQKWTAAVKDECIKTGHWEVASNQIGEVLFYTSQDESGLWEKSVCELLDSKEDVEFRSGLRIKIFNSRGVHGFSGGKEEIELAEHWEAVAAHAENMGYMRLGSTLRSLGSGYREDAKRFVQEHRHQFD